MEIHIWKGFHSDEIKQLVRAAWEENSKLVILCPPHLLDTDFIHFLPQGRLSWHGNWETENLPTHSGARNISYPEIPILGVFTSGTSNGEPRLVLYSRKNILASLQGILKFFDEGRINSIFSYAQPFHTFGLLLGYVLAFEKKWKLHTGTGKYASSFHEIWIESEHQGLLTLGTPTHFKDLISFCESRHVVPRPSYSCICGGAKVSVSLWEDLQHKLKIEAPSIGYGATEASPGITHLPPGKKPKVEGEIGHRLDSVTIHPATDSGYEISGPSVCLAMITSGEIIFPGKVLIRDEIVRRDDDIWVYKGRRDHVLNRGGEKISLNEIEDVLQKKFGKEIMAIAVPHQRLGQELGLLLAGEVEKKEIGLILKGLLLNFDEKYFCQVQHLPLNINLKPDRKKAVELILKEVENE